MASEKMIWLCRSNLLKRRDWLWLA